MEKQNDILNELAELNSPLAGMSRKMPYQLPEGYFDKLSDHLITVLVYEDEPVTDLGNETPFEVPEGYFDLFPSVMFDIVHQQQAKQSVPEGYFDTLPANILATVRSMEHPAKTIALPAKNRTIWKSITWTAAAVLILTLGLLGYNTYNTNHLSAEQNLSKVSASLVDEYVTTHIDDFEAEELLENADLNTLKLEENKVMKTELDEKEIMEYLKETGGGLN